MDPTTKKHPKSTAARRHRHPHPLPDPTITTSSTIQNISHRFSRLYSNQKKLVSNSLKNHPHPQPDPDFQPKNLISDTSCTTLTKSSSQHERNSRNNLNLVITKVMDKDLYMSSETKKESKRSSFDVKKASQLMSKSLEDEGHEIRRRSSVSSIPPMVNGYGGGRRRSFCSSQVELADFFSCTGVKVVAVDMPPFMQIHTVDCARKAYDSLEKFTSKTLAFTLKKEFDGIYGPAWHCIVGTSFGSFVTHSVGGFMYFSMDHKLYVLLFKTTVQRVES